jgi:membrane-associated phospholipid phosphatase
VSVLWKVLVVFVVTGAALFPLDLAILEWVRRPESEFLEGMAEELGTWGDFVPFNVGLAVVLWVGGWLRGDGRLRRAALAFLLAGALSGGTARVVKVAAGRARPSAVESRGLHWVTFRGPTAEAKFHGYFSGHTAATWGGAVVLAVLYPRVGWLVVVTAGAVGWSRLYGNHHYPTDVVHGAAWGVAWGWLVASGLELAGGGGEREGHRGAPATGSLTSSATIPAVGGRNAQAEDLSP